jgi:hypothetical protein
MDTLPTNLTTEQAIELAELLKQARVFLRDASASRIYSPNYASASSKIADVLRTFDIDSG